MRKRFSCLNQKGFTLIEMISVMIIMGVVASVSIQKFNVVTDNAHEQALITGIKELNVREALIWSNIKISTDGYTNDENLWTLMQEKSYLDLGTDYVWSPEVPGRLTGGTLSFKTASRSLNRQESTELVPGRWY
jgi:prepilin-type N-terminal cleavage/methylation domain-containing protein